jgi:hypothetical protein
MDQTTYLAAIAALCIIAAAHPPLIARPNVGVVFNKDKDVSISPTVWHHTVAVPFFPDLPPTRQRLVCNNSLSNQSSLTETCSLLQDLHAMYTQLVDRLQSDVSNIHTSILDVMTLSQKKARTRTPRGWFNLLGNVAKKVMGVATEDDIKVLQKHMSELMHMIRLDKKDRIHDVTKLHSYEIKIDHRMDKLQKHLAALDNTLTTISQDILVLQNYAQFAQTLAKQVDNNMHHINATYRTISWLHNYNIHVNTLSQLRMTAASQLSAVSQLIQGRLTIDIIQPQHLRDIVSSINALLKQQSAGLYISSDISLYYRQANSITVSFDDYHLFVKIRLPVISPDTEFELYKVTALPVPTSQNNSIHTVLTGLSDWLAIAKDGLAFIELSHEQTHDMTQIMSPRNYLPRPASNSSCILNLFFGLSGNIINTCNHRLVRDPIASLEFVYSFNSGYLIYTPTRTWTTSCTNGSLTSIPRPFSHQGLFYLNIQLYSIVLSHHKILSCCLIRSTVLHHKCLYHTVLIFLSITNCIEQQTSSH